MNSGIKISATFLLCFLYLTTVFLVTVTKPITVTEKQQNNISGKTYTISESTDIILQTIKTESNVCISETQTLSSNKPSLSTHLFLSNIEKLVFAKLHWVNKHLFFPGLNLDSPSIVFPFHFFF